MTDLEEELQQLGLSEYLEVLVAEGFDTWETGICNLLARLQNLPLHCQGFDDSTMLTLTCRQKLQRAIDEWRRQTHNHNPPIVRTKRKYTRHPKVSTVQARHFHAFAQANTYLCITNLTQPDEHAPERPPSAYVIFSNQVRASLNGQQLSFTEIAKLVGERWRNLPAEAREAYQRQADTAKEKYYTELAEYKKSSEYDAYQKYSQEFKAKHAALHDERKHSRLETQTRTEYGDQRPNSEVSSIRLNPFIAKHDQGKLSPTVSLPRPPTYSYLSKWAPSATHSVPILDSARLADPGSPAFSSSGLATLHQEGTLDLRPIIAARDFSDRNSDLNIPVNSSSYRHQPINPSTTLPSLFTTSHYNNPVDSPLNQSFRKPTRLPSLTHDGTILSMEGGREYDDTNYVGSSSQLVNDPEFTLPLLRPLPRLGPTPFSLDQPAQISSPTQQTQELQPYSSSAAIVRTGELARIADAEAVDMKSSL
ncbi:High mobility group protein B3 [Paraphaeosphaeria sporulosa]